MSLDGALSTATTINELWQIVDDGLGTGGGGTDDQTASEVSVTTSTFTGNLSGADDTVQKALETLDDVNPTSFTAAAASDHTASGLTTTFTANENQAFGDVCYINADGEMQLADADAIASAKVVAMCISATVSADASGTYLLQGFARDDTWAWTVGGFVYLSISGTTGNTLSQTAVSGTDDCMVIVGVATHADRLYFNPQLVIIELE
jgi:hypothetical protein